MLRLRHIGYNAYSIAIYKVQRWTNWDYAKINTHTEVLIARLTTLYIKQYRNCTELDIISDHLLEFLVPRL